jgi:hypothetical protein
MNLRATFRSEPAGGTPGAAILVGVAAVVFSALYFVSDLVELAQGGFSTSQLVLTYVAEAAIPLFVIGLYAVQRPQIGRLGFWGAIGYSYTFIFYSSTVVVALANGTSDWDALVVRFGPWVTIHGALMLVAGSVFGVAVIRARVLPRWTGASLVAGVILVGVSSVLPAIAQTASAGVRDLAFAGMGAALLLPSRGRRLAGVRALTIAKDEGVSVGTAEVQGVSRLENSKA